ncbi:MAG: EamA family transporter [Rhodobacteraceae bacterium]|nr:MAG: EamA family transporter [Paracoccaceae bacterium]
MTPPDAAAKLSVLPPLAAALVCFAANSVLCRAALAEEAIGPASFTALRLVSGAIALLLIAAAAGRGRAIRECASALPAAALFAYAAGFSFAYVALDAGTGALILFGAVQATMFAGALIGGERPGPARWLGGAAAFGGLAWLAAPGAGAPEPLAAGLMAMAGAAWGVFSLRGRRAGAPLPTMAAAFALSAPVSLLLWGAFGADETVTWRGAALAVASGAAASGGGYAIWYGVLPRIEATMAAVAQLAVPLLALAGGILFLGEAASPRFAPAALLILGGVGVATLIGARPSGVRKRR